MVKILSKIMGDSGDRLAKKFKPWVDEINSLGARVGWGAGIPPPGQN